MFCIQLERDQGSQIFKKSSNRYEPVYDKQMREISLIEGGNGKTDYKLLNNMNYYRYEKLGYENKECVGFHK